MCWGECGGGKCAAPAGPFVQISAGTYHSCGLRSDGTAVCWGCGYRNPEYGPDMGQCNAPGGSFTQIAAGWLTSCALDTDGGVSCWGNEPAPSGDLEFSQISLCGGGACGLTTMGEVVCWDGYAEEPSSPLSLISVGTRGGCGITRDGELSCWGHTLVSGPPSGQFVDVGMCGVYACAVAVDGSVHCWGDDSDGTLHGPEADRECM